MFSYFLLRGKVRKMSATLSWRLYCRRPCRKNYISGYIWHKSFIQMVKCFFVNQIIVYESFYHTLLKLFLLQKFCVSARVNRKDTCEMFIKRVEKIISPVLFDTNCSFEWLNTLSLTKELFIEVSTVHRWHLFSSFFKESCVFRHPFQSCLLGPCSAPCDEKIFCLCLLHEDMGLLKRVSSVLFDKNLIQ